MTYDEGLAIRDEWVARAQAEWIGFSDAKEAPEKRSPELFARNPKRRERYEQGLQDGLAMLQADQVHVHG